MTLVKEIDVLTQMVKDASDHLSDAKYIQQISKYINVQATDSLKTAALVHASEQHTEATAQAIENAQLQISLLETKMMMRTKIVDGLGKFMQSGRAGT
jgi:trans-aconitate methyltransferase